MMKMASRIILQIKDSRLNALEMLEINRRKFDNVLLNNQLDINNSPL